LKGPVARDGAKRNPGRLISNAEFQFPDCASASIGLRATVTPHGTRRHLHQPSPGGAGAGRAWPGGIVWEWCWGAPYVWCSAFLRALPSFVTGLESRGTPAELSQTCSDDPIFARSVSKHAGVLSSASIFKMAGARCCGSELIVRRGAGSPLAGGCCSSLPWSCRRSPIPVIPLNAQTPEWAIVNR